MSLINQVLKDLDQRRADGAATSLPREVRPLPAVRGRRGPLLAAGLAFGVAVAAALWAWQAFGPARPLPEAPSLHPQAALSAALPPLTLSEPAPGGASGPVAAGPASMQAARTGGPASPPAEAGRLPDGATGLRLSPELSLPVASRPPPASPVPASAISGPAVRRAAPPVAPAPAVAVAEASPPDSPGVIDVQAVVSTPQERADRLYRGALELLTQGRSDDGLTTLRAALREDPAHFPARQMLVKLYLDSRAWDAAQGVLADGLALLPGQADWAMLLARLHAERGQVAGALAVLEKHEEAGRSNAAYQGALGAILLRAGRQTDALARFAEAVRLEPRNGRWSLGQATVHEALGNAAAAREAYQRALSVRTLSPELQAFVEAKLK